MEKDNKGGPKVIMQPPLEIDEDLYKKQSSSSFSVQEALSELLQKPPFSTIMDVLNGTLSVSINLIYVWRTEQMCLFDKEPIWRWIDPEGGE